MANRANGFKTFFLEIPTVMGQLLERFGLAETEQAQSEGSRGAVGNTDHWTKIMVTFCVATALQVASVSAQIQPQLPPIFRFFSFVILFAVASFFVSNFIDSAKFPQTARALERVGVFLSVTGFFIALTIPFPQGLCLKVTTWVVYVICLAVILVCNCFCR
ncbi:hypothetical protein PanWU01x14_210410 [Parasponia andersonii]|uniref:Uncharacterized protein n=1 Tax=Parasponia andersonii TaxID=3476 RepID=A0A2P5BTS3_PARAD|nr:hypothetical protein PanWU01x14_210410 [Parasponia andersonii]